MDTNVRGVSVGWEWGKGHGSGCGGFWEVGGVNVAKDSYLTSSMAWELNLANQNPVRQESFHFGRPNYYPMIAHLYKNGTKTVEYTGVQSSKAVAKWVTQMVKSSTSDIGPVVVLTSKDDVEALVLKNIDFPTVVGCFATKSTEIDAPAASVDLVKI